MNKILQQVGILASFYLLTNVLLTIFTILSGWGYSFLLINSLALSAGMSAVCYCRMVPEALSKLLGWFEYVPGYFPQFVVYVFLLIVTGYSLLSIAPPETFFAQDVFKSLSYLSFFAFFLVNLRDLIRTVSSIEHSNIALNLLKKNLIMILVFSAVIGTVGEIGDFVYLWCIENTLDAYVFLVAFSLCYISLGWISSMKRFLDNTFPGGAYSVGDYAMHKSKNLTKSDIATISLHECCHAIFYAALGSIPDRVCVEINDTNMHQDFSGAISKVRLKNALSDARFEKWLMHVYLAGSLGEELFLGKSCLGAQGDMGEWNRIADTLLINQECGLFYVVAGSEYKQAHNHRMHETLYEEQKALVLRVLELNRDLLLEMAAELEITKAFDASKLRPYLARVVFPEKFTFPFEGKETFSFETPGHLSVVGDV